MDELFWFFFWAVLCILCGVVAHVVSGKVWAGVVASMAALIISPKIVGAVVVVAWIVKKVRGSKAA